MLLALPVLFIQYSQYKGLYMHYSRILPKHISHTIDCNKPVQIIRNQILFILGLSIRNKLTVWFLWSQGTFGSQLCWLTPGLKKKKKKKSTVSVGCWWWCFLCLLLSSAGNVFSKHLSGKCSHFSLPTPRFLCACTSVYWSSAAFLLYATKQKLWEEGLRWGGVKQTMLRVLWERGNEMWTQYPFSFWN